MHASRWLRPVRSFRSHRPLSAVRAVAVAASLALVAAPAASAAEPPADPPATRTEVSVSPVDLDGPAISTVTVSVSNSGQHPMRSLKVSFFFPLITY